MAFRKKAWKDRRSEHPNRRKLIQTAPDVYEVSRDEGLVTEAGDKLDATNLNALENRIADAFNETDNALKDKAGKSDLQGLLKVESFVDGRLVTSSIK